MMFFLYQYRFVILAIAIVVWFVSTRYKSKYYAQSMRDLNLLRKDHTMEVLEKIRAIWRGADWNFDVFETDCNSLVFCNVGLIIYGDTDNPIMVGYDTIKRISEPEIPNNKNGKAVKFMRTITIENVNGRVHTFNYWNKKNNRFEELFDNIRKHGYPLPEYQGCRKIEPIQQEKQDELLEMSDNTLYEGH